MKIFDPAHVTDLRTWLKKALEPICDADPEVLSDYVIALLKRDVPDSEVTEVLQEQLVDFTGDETAKFVESMVATLTSKSYVSGGAGADGAGPSGAGTESSEYRPTEDNPRKRRPEDEGRSSPPKMHSLPAMPFQPGFPDQQQQPFRGGAGPRGAPRLPKGMCIDYHVRGFCPRGDSCKYTHSEDQVPGSMPGVPLNSRGGPMPPMNGPPLRFGQAGPAPQPGGRLEQRLGPVPNNHIPYGGPGPIQVPWQQPPMWNGGMPQNGFGMGPGSPGPGGMHMNGGGPSPMRAGGQRHGRGSGNPGSFNVRKSDTTLVIENVPKESLDLIKINDFFKKFGTITNIQIDASAAKALVSFALPAQAKAAHESPESIFGSRFVKCFFQRIEEPVAGPPGGFSSPSPSRPAQGGPSGPPQSFVPGQLQHVYVAPGQGHAIEAEQERRRLVAAQEAAQSKLKQLVGEQKTLLGRLSGPNATLSADDKKAAMARLRVLESEVGKATADAKAAIEAVSKLPPLPTRPTQSDYQKKKEQLERDKLDRELEELGSPAPKKEGDSDTSADLKAQLAKLKAEAASMGLDETGKPIASSSFPWRGASRGRGRGRGAPSWRGGRGGATGFSLDNRTTKVHVTELPSDADVEKAKAWFKSFGDVDSFVDGQGKEFTIVYKARQSGESAIQALRTSGTVPDVGSAKASWATAGSTTPSTAVKAEGVSSATDSSSASASAVPDDNEVLPEFEDDEDREQNWRRS